jgi:hypothetical protein
MVDHGEQQHGRLGAVHCRYLDGLGGPDRPSAQQAQPELNARLDRCFWWVRDFRVGRPAVERVHIEHGAQLGDL